MNFLQKLKLFSKLSNAIDQIQGGFKMKNVTKIFGGIIFAATAILQVPAVNSALANFYLAHPNVGSILAGVAGLLALFHQPENK